MAGFKTKAPRTGFNRPTSAMSQDVDREWRDVYAKDLEPGDIVTGMGLVISVERIIRPFVDVEAGVPESKRYHIYGLEPVKAFVRKVN